MGKQDNRFLDAKKSAKVVTRVQNEKRKLPNDG